MCAALWVESRVEKNLRFGRPAEYLDQVDSCQDDGGGCGVCVKTAPAETLSLF
jgi:hypothetical protein